MVKWLLKTIVGNKNQRELKKILPLVEEINEMEKELQNGSEEQLKEKTQEWRDYLDRYKTDLEFYSPQVLKIREDDINREILIAWAKRFDILSYDFSQLSSFVSVDEVADLSGEELADKIIEPQRQFNEIKDDFPNYRKEYLDDILPEAFAVVKNAARRLCGTEWIVCDHPVEWQMVHFDVQLIGGTALHRGFICEMATGEGKTLVATLPVYLNALTGLGVHVVTVNDYLARRDSEWMGHLFEYLGLSTGCIQNEQSPEVRKQQYENCLLYTSDAADE